MSLISYLHADNLLNAVKFPFVTSTLFFFKFIYWGAWVLIFKWDFFQGVNNKSVNTAAPKEY